MAKTCAPKYFQLPLCQSFTNHAYHFSIPVLINLSSKILINKDHQFTLCLIPFFFSVVVYIRQKLQLHHLYNKNKEIFKISALFEKMNLQFKIYTSKNFQTEKQFNPKKENITLPPQSPPCKITW